MQTIKRQQRTVGAIVKIPLENGYHTYARILETRLAFYDERTKDELDIEEIVNKPVLFTIEVYDEIITKGHWLKIGKKLPVENNPEFNKPFYTEDIFSGKHHIVIGIKQIPATIDEIKGLEAYIIWDKEGIEARLNDHFANRKNEDTENIKAGTPVSGMFEQAKRIKKELNSQKKQAV